MSNNKIDKKNLNNHKSNITTIKNNVNDNDIKYDSDFLLNELRSKLLELEKKLINTKSDLTNDEEQHFNRKKVILEKENKFSLKKIIFEILPTIDSLERAYSLLIEKQDKKEVYVRNLLKCVLKSLLLTIKKFGVDSINSINVEFDPNVHQAISMQKSNSIQENHILSIVQNGYLLNGRLLRPAMVIVSKK
ncbi:Protein GrpE [Buchnera aphidicola (Anoecia corni)]|uniref:Protein GrpE n=1 Tax=Buchnera aphidicola (Anoecia corni) TaxID=2994477 RepID=A0AAT9IGH0_9GAMM